MLDRISLAKDVDGFHPQVRDSRALLHVAPPRRAALAIAERKAVVWLVYSGQPATSPLPRSSVEHVCGRRVVTARLSVTCRRRVARA